MFHDKRGDTLQYDLISFKCNIRLYFCGACRHAAVNVPPVDIFIGSMYYPHKIKDMKTMLCSESLLKAINIAAKGLRRISKRTPHIKV